MCSPPVAVGASDRQRALPAADGGPKPGPVRTRPPPGRQTSRSVLGAWLARDTADGFGRGLVREGSVSRDRRALAGAAREFTAWPERKKMPFSSVTRTCRALRWCRARLMFRGRLRDQELLWGGMWFGARQWSAAVGPGAIEPVNEVRVVGLRRSFSEVCCPTRVHGVSLDSILVVSRELGGDCGFQGSGRGAHGRACAQGGGFRSVARGVRRPRGSCRAYGRTFWSIPLCERQRAIGVQ